MWLTALVSAGAVSMPSASSVTVGHSTLSIPCGPGVTVAVDWYLPSAPATGVVLLQHGYSGQKADVAPLARAIVAKSGALVVAPSMNSSGSCSIETAAMHQAVAQVFASRSALVTSAAAAGWNKPVPEAFVLAGHSAGGNLALDAARYLAGTAAFSELRSVVLFDGGTTNTTSQAPSALQAIPGKQVLTVSSPPGTACKLGDTTPAIVAARPGQFVGVQIENGLHLDAIGYAGSAFWGFVVCGWPAQANVAATQQIGSDWITNALTGASLGITSGTSGQRIPVGQATAVVL